MAENLLKRLEGIAEGVLPGKLQIQSLGEDYFSFDITEEQGAKTALPHIWIDSDASDEEIREKLRRSWQAALHPETLPDDASVPTLKTEEKRGEL